MKNFKMLFSLLILLGFYSCTEDVVTTQSLIDEDGDGIVDSTIVVPDSLQQIINFKNSLNPETNPEELFGYWKLEGVYDRQMRDITNQSIDKVLIFDFQINVNGETIGDKCPVYRKMFDKTTKTNVSKNNKCWKISKLEVRLLLANPSYDTESFPTAMDTQSDKIDNFKIINDTLNCKTNDGYTAKYSKVIDY